MFSGDFFDIDFFLYSEEHTIFRMKRMTLLFCSLGGSYCYTTSRKSKRGLVICGPVQNFSSHPATNCTQRRVGCGLSGTIQTKAPARATMPTKAPIRTTTPRTTVKPPMVETQRDVSGNQNLLYRLSAGTSTCI